jgi:hypothetical protein
MVSPEDLALDLFQLTLIAVALSIFVHGTRVKPLMSRFLRYRKRLPKERVCTSTHRHFRDRRVDSSIPV